MSEMLLSAADILAFRNKIKEFYAALRKKGIVCKMNWTCCQSCGHAEMPSTAPSYIFFHSQTNTSLKKGASECHFAHSIEEKKCDIVYDIIRSFGGWWDKSSYATIILPFVPFTEEQLEQHNQSTESVVESEFIVSNDIAEIPAQ